MIEGVEISGGADEFQAAVIAVVLDQITREERGAHHGRADGEPGLPAWVRALHPEEPNLPRDAVRPDGG